MKACPAVLALLVSSCTAAVSPPPPPPPPPLPAPPADLLSCPEAPPEPMPLPKIITTDRLRQGFEALEDARQAERQRGDICAAKLTRLNHWIRTDEQSRRALDARSTNQEPESGRSSPPE